MLVDIDTGERSLGYVAWAKEGEGLTSLAMW